MVSGTTTDAATLAIFGKALAAAAQEMGINLVRAAYSTVVRETRDCSAALLDTEGSTDRRCPYGMGSSGQSPDSSPLGQRWGPVCSQLQSSSSPGRVATTSG